MVPLRLILAMLFCVPSMAAAAPAPLVQERLDNGLQVTLVPDPSMPVVATQVWYHVGSADEDEGSRGLAHLFEHLMFGPTTSRPGREYSDYHVRHGGDENAYTTPDETVYLSEIAPQHHGGVLEREADRMVNLVLDEAALANEKRIVTEELRLRVENDPLVRLFSRAQHALLRGHPYDHDPAGTKEDIAAATLASARAFYDSHYRPSNAHLVVVGPVDPAATMDVVRDTFGRIAGRDTPRRMAIPPVTDLEVPPRIVLEDELPPAEISVLGFPLPPADHPDAWALLVLEQLVSRGAIDALRHELVDRREHALEAGTEWLRLRRGGALLFYSVSLPYRREETAFRWLHEARRDLSQLRWLGEDSLAAAKRALLRREVTDRYYAAARAGTVGQAGWWLGDAALGLDRARRIEAVTRADVARVWRIYVGAAQAVELHLRPEKVPWYVHLFGWLVPLFVR